MYRWARSLVAGSRDSVRPLAVGRGRPLLGRLTVLLTVLLPLIFCAHAALAALALLVTTFRRAKRVLTISR